MGMNGQPVYTTIASRYRKLILSGALKPGDPLPSVREVALMEKINPNTAARAFSILVQEGLVTSIEKKGYFIAEGATNRDEALHQTLSELLARGFTKEEIENALDRLGGQE